MQRRQTVGQRDNNFSIIESLWWLPVVEHHRTHVCSAGHNIGGFLGCWLAKTPSSPGLGGPSSEPSHVLLSIMTESVWPSSSSLLCYISLFSLTRSRLRQICLKCARVKMKEHKATEEVVILKPQRERTGRRGRVRNKRDQQGELKEQWWQGEENYSINSSIWSY